MKNCMENLAIRQCDGKDIETLRTLCVKTFTETFLAENTPDDIATYVTGHFNTRQLGRELGDANPMRLLGEYHGTHSFKLGNDLQQDHIMRLDL